MVRRLAIVLVITVVVVLGAPLPAWAHVEVSPSEAAAGSETTLTFQVPNEESNATTTKVEVHFPEGDDEAIAAASVQPAAGWTVKVNTAKLTTPITTDEGDSLDTKVTSIVWTATGNGIAEGEFQQFLVSVGLPDKEGDLLFPTTQTYSNGDAVEWNEASTGGAEPEHPAPTVTLGAAASDTTPTTAASGNGAKASAAASASGAVKSAQDDADNAKTLGIIALILGAIALIVGIVAVLTGRRRTT
jgi:uncharacterized protein YcnI